MIAIPIMRGRVAPVLNWCSRTMIFPAKPDGGSARELWTPELGPAARLQLLRDQGVQTLICGALSLDLQNCAMGLGLTVIPGVAGNIEEVIQAYRQDRLDQPEFWLPGCSGPRRYRQGLRQGSCLANARNQRDGSVRPRGRKAAAAQGNKAGGRCRENASGPGTRTGAANFCVCPACGTKTPHERGIPCTQVNCPQCGQPLVRG
jgi:predicted Fe-Mo cluster-binding NifX family protein